MQSPLVERLGLSATTETALHILDGEDYDAEGLEDSTKEVLQYLALKKNTKQFFTPKPLDVAECQADWRKATERTCSSMKNGVHFGHWITGHGDTEIAEIHTRFANIPYM